ncbi:hypothetical protein KA977_03445, partial [Candidatus Dependentiae bacterium]|nr:hypothetical protein [Candidatus Dependentiae bacterium]
MLVWSCIYDISGIKRIELKFREDNNGVNDLATNSNELYSDNPGEVGSWQSLSMTKRNFPSSKSGVDPIYRADIYEATITTVKEKLIDYYIEVEDSLGNISKSIIQHCWIGGGSGGQIGNWTPGSPASNQAITIWNDKPGKLHWGVNNWTLPNSVYWPTGSVAWGDGKSIETVLVKTGDTYSVQIGPFNNSVQTVTQVNFVFHNDDNTWGQDKSITVAQAVNDVTPPSSPQNVRIGAGNEYVDLVWNSNNESDLAGYNVYYSASQSGPFIKLNDSLISKEELLYRIGNLENDVRHYFYLTAVDNSDTPNESASSSAVSAVPQINDTVAPDKPENLNGTAGVEQMSLSWSSVKQLDLNGYNVYRKEDTGSFTLLVSLNKTTVYTDRDLRTDVTYYYYVTSVDTAGNQSLSSDSVYGQPFETPPPATPTGFTAQAGNQQVTFQWNQNTESDLKGYKLYYKTYPASSDKPYILVDSMTYITGTIYVDTGLSNGETYIYYISAINQNNGESVKSNGITVNPRGQISVTFNLNMNGAGSFNNVTIAGNLLSPAWSSTSNALTNSGNGIWTKTLIFDPNASFQYKYVTNSTNWEFAFPTPSNNREQTIVDQSGGVMVINDVWNGPVIIQSPVINGNVVTFNYSDASASQVSIKGNWKILSGSNGNYTASYDADWAGGAATQMVKSGNIWSITIKLDANRIFEYGFMKDGQWVNDPLNANHSGTGNDQFTSGQELNPDNAIPIFSGLQSCSDAVSGGKVNLSWQAAIDSTLPVIYNIYYTNDYSSSVSKSYVDNTPDFTTENTYYQVSGLTNGITYYFLVRAEDGTTGKQGPNGGNQDTNVIQMSAVPSGNVSDNIPPVISNILMSPASPNSSQNVMVTANITDDLTGVDTVILKYSIDNWSTYSETQMIYISSGNYSGYILKQNNGITVRYMIIASDKSTSVNNSQSDIKIYTVTDVQQSPVINDKTVTFNYYGSATTAKIKGSWKILSGSNGVYNASYDVSWNGGVTTDMIYNGSFWTITLTLDSYREYEYGFEINGNWANDQLNSNHNTGGNDIFSLGNSPVISGNRITFNYYGSAATAKIKGSWKITGGSNGSYTGIYDASWDGGTATSMLNLNNMWTATLTLEYGKTYEYGFEINGNWTNDPLNPNHTSGGNDRFSVEQYVNQDTLAPVFSGIISASDANEGGKINLAWNSGSDSTLPVTYNIYYTSDFTAHQSKSYVDATPDFSVQTNSYQVTGLTNGVIYYFVVRAEDGVTGKPGPHGGNEDNNLIELNAVPSGIIIDNNPPVINNVNFSPMFPRSENSVTVTATIIDELTGIDSVNLYYSADNWINTSTVNMTSASENLYSGVIPAQLDGTTVKYYLKAFDNASVSNSSISSIRQYSVTDLQQSPVITNRNIVTVNYYGTVNSSAKIKGSFQITSGSNGNYTARYDANWNNDAKTNMIFNGSYWTITLTLDFGYTYEYGFEIDGTFTNDPLNSNHSGNGNDIVNIQSLTWNLSDQLIPSDWSGHTYTASPDDWRKLSVYQIMLDRFNDGDPSNNNIHSYSTSYNAASDVYPQDLSRRTIGGDFIGLISKLDYIKSLGFDVIWISNPFFGTEPNGYAPCSYSALDPKLGTVEDFRRLVNEIHSRGMYIIVDCVANHFGNWLNDNTGSKSWKYSGREYGMIFGDAIGINDFHDAWNINDWNNTWEIENKELVGLDDLKTENQYVKDFVADKWANFIKAFDIDGFRVDAIKHVNVAEWSYFCDKWRKAAGESPVGKSNFYMFGEAYSGDHGAVGYYTGYKSSQANRLMNGMMDYAMYMGGVPWKLFNDQWGLKNWIAGMNNSSYDMGQGSNWSAANMNLHFLDNHDQQRFLGDGGAWDRMLPAWGLISLIEGVGGLYYGSEQCFNTGGKDGRGAYSAMFDHPYQFDNAAGDKFDMTNWMYKKIAKMMAARRKISSELGTGTNLLDPQNGIFAFKRGRAFIAINPTDSTKTASYNMGNGTFTNLVDGSQVNGTNASITLPKYEVGIWLDNVIDAVLEPMVASVSPSHYSTITGNEIVISFDQDMDPAATIAAASITPDVGGTWSLSGKILRLTNANIVQGTKYTIRIEKTAKSTGINGKNMYAAFVSNFTGGRLAATIPVTFTLDMRNQTQFTTVQLAGNTLNPAWSPASNQMQSLSSGIYQITVNLAAGEQFLYKYTTDNTNWEQKFSTASMNREITVSDQGSGKMYVSNKFNQLGDDRPLSPGNLTGNGSSGIAVLNWMTSSEFDIKGYNVYRTTTQNGSYTKIGSNIIGNSYSDNTVTNGQIYYYVVRSVDLSGQESLPTNQLAITVGSNIVPDSPVNLTAFSGNSQINLVWRANSEQDLKGYYIYRSSTSGSNYVKVNVQHCTTAYYTVSGLTNGVTYYFVVTAVDVYDSESIYSREVSASPSNIDIIPPSPPRNLNATAGNGKIDLQWTANAESDLDGYN